MLNDKIYIELYYYVLFISFSWNNLLNLIFVLVSSFCDIWAFTDVARVAIITFNAINYTIFINSFYFWYCIRLVFYSMTRFHRILDKYFLFSVNGVT